jgi:excisionase family DNA binding protein
MSQETRAEEALPELWKVGRVCEVLNLSQPSVYRLMERGELPYVRFGRARRVRKSDVMALLQRNTVTRA